MSTVLMFAACDTRQCENITIVDDETLELTETFTVTLDRTPALDTRITLSPVDGDINILDGRKYEDYFSHLEIPIYLKMVQLLYYNCEVAYKL